MSDTCHPFAEPEPDIMPALDGVDIDELAEWANRCWSMGANPITGEPLP